VKEIPFVLVNRHSIAFVNENYSIVRHATYQQCPVRPASAHFSLTRHVSSSRVSLQQAKYVSSPKTVGQQSGPTSPKSLHRLFVAQLPSSAGLSVQHSRYTPAVSLRDNVGTLERQKEATKSREALHILENRAQWNKRRFLPV